MSKVKKDLTFNQGGLFDRGCLDVSAPFREAMSKAVRGCKHSRDDLAALMEVLTGQGISKQYFDQTTAPSHKDKRFPAEGLTAFCAITGSLEPFRALLHPLGCEVIDPAESKDLKLLRLQRDKERIEAEIERLKKEDRS